MMILQVIYAFLAVAVLGALLGFGLAFAAKKLAVEKDERIVEVEEALPGANCGACGFAGCSAYAEAIVMEGAEIDLCAPGGSETINRIAEIMGKETTAAKTKMVAKVHCNGNFETSRKDFDYQGLEDCNAAYIYFQGDKTCKYGCLALGSCIAVCPVNAITKGSDDKIYVDKEICIGCEKCVDVCPTGVMKMIPYDADYYVACNSLDKGGAVRKYCSVGCIGCKICERKFPDAGFEVKNNLSLTKYDKEYSERAEAAEACPTKCIHEI
ncbi:MAG: RnfABCDGE type electron transport complex subunit B [Spirochaetia bacterium]|nr:RnfABCDGE type electron transport complex subunit B [Spirochaetia bacterium]